MKLSKVILILFGLFISSCSKDNYTYTPIDFPNTLPLSSNISDSDLLELTQKNAFKYFWNYAESNSGCARERYHVDNPDLDAHTIATGGTGFGLMSIIVAIENNYITRNKGVERINKIINFLDKADRFHGAWPHWIDGLTGHVIPFSSTDDGGDIVETAYLCQGLICVKEYLKNGSPSEKAIADKAKSLWQSVEWNWYTQGQNVLYWHWSPNYGYSNLKLVGYNEVLITYILAASSPNYSISKTVYSNGWASNGGIISSNTKYGIPLVVKHQGAQEYGGPLFWAHYSYLGLNPTYLSDEFVNYWDVNYNQITIDYKYCVSNPLNYKDYGPNCWGLTASYSRNSDGSIGYSAHKPNNDLGVISPTAAISSIVYTPDKSISALHYFYNHKDKLLGPAGFYDAFSPQYNFWVAKAYLAIDQGPIIIMIENYKTKLIWNLFMNNSNVKNGLNKLNFTF